MAGGAMDRFQVEFEQRIRQLKSAYLTCCYAERPQGGERLPAQALRGAYAAQLAELRALVQANLAQFHAAQASSLLALPTRALADEARILHRIWLGSGLPEMAKASIAQWNAALAQPGVGSYRQWLWVWDAAQLQHDPHFVADINGGACLGSYRCGEASLAVYSLASLARLHFGSLYGLLDVLQARGYYVNLADFFRLVLLREHGGIYLDADTMPYRSAPIFLARPELPDYLAADGSTVSWLNLYRDENAVLVAAPGDAAVAAMVDEIAVRLHGLPTIVPPMSRAVAAARHYAALLQEATYGVWAAQMGRSFLAYGELAEHCCVLHDGSWEEVPCGIEGMRLTVDALSNAPQPLSEAERAGYMRCVDSLAAQDWRLDDALALEALADVYTVREHARMAYPAQLRSRLANCAYYSFLSHDERLDRVNRLFGRYLLAHNARRMAEPGYWRRTGGELRGQAAPAFVPGQALSEESRNRVAQLLFATSYLEYCSYGNKLNLSFVELQRRQNVDPYLGLVRGMVDAQGCFTGFFTAGTAADFDRVGAVSYYRDEMRAMDAAYDDFVLRHMREDDLLVSSLAIDEPRRGQGLFRPMLREIGQLARGKGCRRVVLTVWEHKSNALPIYLGKGFRQEGVFDYARELFFDRLHFLSCEPQTILAHAYRH